MNCEMFFEINGSDAEQKAVIQKIFAFMLDLEERGDIAALDGTPDPKGGVQ